MDPYKPITMVFCCVDPSEYISGFDIGQLSQCGRYPLCSCDGPYVYFSSYSCAGMADPYPIPNSPPESVCC